MKKAMSVILAIVSVICLVVSASGEGITTVDFSKLSSLSNEDLIACEELIGNEKATRGLGVLFPVGVYVVGKDIAPGNYIVKHVCYSEIKNTRIYICVYEDSSMSTMISELTDEGSCEIYVSLSEGQVMEFKEDSTSDTESKTFIDKTAGLYME